MSNPPLTHSIGSAERAMRALLEHVLASKHLSFTQWTANTFRNYWPRGQVGLQSALVDNRVDYANSIKLFDGVHYLAFRTLKGVGSAQKSF
jgi:hypothetical protein